MIRYCQAAGRGISPCLRLLVPIRENLFGCVEIPGKICYYDHIDAQGEGAVRFTPGKCGSKEGIPWKTDLFGARKM